MADYTDLSECLMLVHTLTQGRSESIEAITSLKLRESAATLDEDTFYRPYYVAAKILQQSFKDQTFTSIPDHELTNLTPIITSYLQEQQAIDLTRGWDVPAAYSAGAALGERVVTWGIDLI